MQKIPAVKRRKPVISIGHVMMTTGYAPGSLLQLFVIKAPSKNNKSTARKFIMVKSIR